ncbi:DNA binding methylated-DNA--cysteine S-methyltransferase [Lecanosticta acicola]|uniref:Methylated-DNA--protein-cysteine methyltransferase n=1 Tax=Lecanosticta acicola TaxID=111012 RepID=A0AAI8YSY6_9PEZI|nr:DNA binding methylated-DNA--cysteine S-methyltransferase [Lecanosticta acicola]
MKPMGELQERWRYLYQDFLPAMAKARDPAQRKWPVHLDHCFARIILDNSIGKDRPWNQVVKSPAVKNMTDVQLESAIAMAERLASGEADLQELDQRSLDLRGKTRNKKRKADDDASVTEGSKKYKKASPTVSSYFLPSPASPQKTSGKNEKPDSQDKHDKQDPNVSSQLKRIQDSSITAFRKQTLTMLCQIPRGRYSTYGAMSDWISNNSHKTCARAVGNAMRNNPFAPEVPCHRVLAGDGTLGGFKGSWGEEGKYAKHKHELLHEEGVRFDSQGKVKGPPFRAFI